MPQMDMPRKARIQVLWLTKGLGPGGAERLLVSFAGKADRDRFDIQVAYLLPWKDHLVGDLAALGVPAHNLDGRREFDLRWAHRLRALVRRSHIDVVHAHSPLVAALARPAMRAMAGRPALIGTEHNVWSSHHPATRLANRLTLPLEDWTLAVSNEVRMSMPPRLARRAEVVIHGVDVDVIAGRRSERAAARAELGVRDDEVIVATVANLRKQKDYPTMLKAARSLAETGRYIRFVSVGQGPLQDQLEAERDRLGLAQTFRFLGYRSDPVRILVGADIFCLSSRYEGLPIALLEAMAAGLPAVATKVGGIPAVMRDGREGYLVDSGDAEGLAMAISRLGDAELRTRMAAAAAARARHFAIDHAVNRQQELYERLTAERR